jgi:ABC-type sulfate/molybdate transport systems ATPase subunit
MSGAHVLKADVEVDRRDFTVRAAITVAPGERLALFGPSGAGKTTLLETIAGLVPPRAGTIELAGRVLTRTSRPRIAMPPWQRRVGLLRQDPGLFPHMSVRDNLSYARSARAAARAGTTGAGSAAGATGAAGLEGAAGLATDAGPAAPGPGSTTSELAQLADALGIGDLMSAMPARLSGGQQHRAALARLLLAHCDALLLDEPYSGLDAALRRSLTALVVRLVTEREVPAILVAHELADAQAFATRLAVMDRGELLQQGSPDEVVLRPASVRVAELVGYLGFARIADQAGVVAGVHPDRVVPGRAPAQGVVLDGTVAASRPAGAGWEVDLLVPGADQPGSVVTCRLADPPGPDGSELAVTALNPPLFGSDGAALSGVPGAVASVADSAAADPGVMKAAGTRAVPAEPGAGAGTGWSGR